LVLGGLGLATAPGYPRDDILERAKNKKNNFSIDRGVLILLYSKSWGRPLVLQF
jgi:hypothetical protein